MEFFTVAEVSQKLKVNKTKVYELINLGLIKATKLGSLKVSSVELERFISGSIGKDFSNLEKVKELNKYV
ncbi:helix-turn-helix domain-containing protein [Clostridium sp. HCS.1]|uniref:helix-turn-helix domain-containing protein n=1 Tax=Clostridium sp. HCS.1 TaxID=3238594 RepID=UPI003A10375A